MEGVCPHGLRVQTTNRRLPLEGCRTLHPQNCSSECGGLQNCGHSPENTETDPVSQLPSGWTLRPQHQRRGVLEDPTRRRTSWRTTNANCSTPETHRWRRISQEMGRSLGLRRVEREGRARKGHILLVVQALVGDPTNMLHSSSAGSCPRTVLVVVVVMSIRESV